CQQQACSAGHSVLWSSPRCQEAATGSARVLLGTALQPDSAAAAKGPWLAGRASDHGKPDKAQGRQAPGLPGIRRPKGSGQVQDHFRPWLLLLQIRRAQRLPGAATGTGHLPAVLRPPGVLRERRAPGADGGEHRRRHRRAGRQPAAGAPVPPHGLLHGRRDHVELPQAHPAQARRRGHSRAGRQLLVVRPAAGRVPGGVVRAVPARPSRRLGRPPPPVAGQLVEHPEAVPKLQRQGPQPRHLLQGRQAAQRQIRPASPQSPDLTLWFVCLFG
uniref:Uncharacterized protein n=1 Tax=Aegilops tauschii subsp. strangulata TaxID=200361 RepID=A0A452Z6J9_AEGTS